MYATALAQAGGYYNITFLQVALPFIVEEISTELPLGDRLLWAGLLVGASPLALTVGTVLWGNLAERYSPKYLLVRAFSVQAVTTALIASTGNLYVILALRVVQGLFGEVATVALIIVLASSEPRRRTSNVGLFQGIATISMTLAPSIGAFTYALFGYRTALLLGTGSAIFAALLVLFFVSDVRRSESRVEEESVTPSRGWTVVVFILVALASAQLVSIVSLFPTVLREFEISGSSAVTYAGLIASGSTIGSSVALIGLGRLADRVGTVRLVTVAALLSAASLALMGITRSVETFLLLRVIQASTISAIFAPIIAGASASGKWRRLSGVQAARYLGAGIGTPIVAILVASLGTSSTFAALALVAVTAVVIYAIESRHQPHTRPRI